MIDSKLMFVNIKVEKSFIFNALLLKGQKERSKAQKADNNTVNQSELTSHISFQ